jgi:hypothetical protein
LSCDPHDRPINIILWCIAGACCCYVRVKKYVAVRAHAIRWIEFVNEVSIQVFGSDVMEYEPVMS